MEATIAFDEAQFGGSAASASRRGRSQFADGQTDLGRLVGFEGSSAGDSVQCTQLRPDASARRALEITVFRAGEALRAAGLDAAVFRAFERWLLKRGWRGNIVKRMKFTDPALVVPIRSFWVRQLGFELILAEDGKWDEHVVKRWR
jgi:hypothetical protein